MTPRARIALAFALLLTALVLALYWPKPAAHQAMAPSGVAAIGGAFQLVDHRSEVVSDQSLRGRPLLIAFGYTSCPDVCQMMLQNISEALDQLGDHAREIEPLFITFDPARDTAQVLADHLDNFHPAIRGLTGTADQVAVAAKAYHVYYKRAEGGDPENYLMEHSSHIYLMDAAGRYVRHFSHHAAPDDIAEAIRAALK